MRINFECSGGYVGLNLKYQVDTNELPPKLADELLKLVESSNVFNLQPSEVAPKEAGPPDVFSYRLTLYSGDKKISLSLNDITAPDSLRPLLSFLQELALRHQKHK